MSALVDLVQEATGDERGIRWIATRAGLEHTRLRRQHIGETPWTVEVVMALVRTFRLSFDQAFVAAGWVTEEEARAMGAFAAVRRASDEELLAEAARRMQPVRSLE